MQFHPVKIFQYSLISHDYIFEKCPLYYAVMYFLFLSVKWTISPNIYLINFLVYN